MTARRRGLTRRGVLRGAGVALALPWLESLAPRRAHAQARPTPRFVAMYFPCGVAQTFWKPKQEGTGADWALSPLLEPLAPVKSSTTVLANVGNQGPFGGNIQPAYANNTVAFLTCTKAAASPPVARCGISVDQVIANYRGAPMKLPSLQVGLATRRSNPDGLPEVCSRSISWAGPAEPLYKVVDPQAVFDRLVGTQQVAPGPGAGVDPFAAARRSANQSVLDYVLGHAASVRPRLGRGDQAQLDSYLTSVRELEKRVAAGSSALCAIGPRPGQGIARGKEPAGYDRNAHADLMIDLVVMALRCDLTRVVSFMLEDGSSDYMYSFLPKRNFTDAGSTPGAGTVPSPRECINQSDSDPGYATLSHWNVQKLARLCQALAAIRDGSGTLLDSSLVWFGSELHGVNHTGLDLPLLYVGGAGGRLAVDRYIDFGKTARGAERLANVYLTFLQKVFDLPVTSFGTAMAPLPGTPPSPNLGGGTEIVPEILL